MRYQGRIASWNEARGFGFITPEQNGAEQATNGSRSAGLFVHVTALQSDGRVPEPGERVTYLIGSGQDGKPRALQVFFPERPLTLADAVPSAESSAARSAASSAAPSFRTTSQPPRPTSTRERSNPYRRRKSSRSGKLIPPAGARRPLFHLFPFLGRVDGAIAGLLFQSEGGQHHCKHATDNDFYSPV